MAIQFQAGKAEQNEFFVEPGNHKLRVIEAKEDSSKKGNEMIKLKLRVVRKDGSDGPALFDYLVFNQKSFWKVDQFLKSCGQHPGEGAPVSIEADMLIGWECEATLKVEEYDGKKNNKVAAYIWEEF